MKNSNEIILEMASMLSQWRSEDFTFQQYGRGKGAQHFVFTGQIQIKALTTLPKTISSFLLEFQVFYGIN